MSAGRIALVAHRVASPAATGIGRYYIEIAKALVVAAHRGRTYVIASTREPGAPSWLPPELDWVVLPGSRKVRALTWAVAGRPAIDGAIGNVDLVHALHPWTATPTRRPLVTTVHDLMPLQHPSFYPRHESWLFGRGIAHVRHHAERVVVPSAHRAEQLVAEAGVEADRIRVVHMAAGDEFRARPDEERVAETCERYGVAPGRYLIAVGQITRRKNLTVVVRALARLDPRTLGAPGLLCVGPTGVGADEVVALVDELGLQSQVRLAGYAAGDDLPVLVGAAAALVHPSYDEGFGMTPVEAMAAGTAVISSDRGALPETVGDGGVLLDADDADAWAAAITAVATDPAHRAALVARGEARQDEFTWARVAELTAAVHDEVIG